MVKKIVLNKPSPNDVWKAARLIWENTPVITDRELVEQLKASFGNEAPKSNGTVSKRRKKEEWVKKSMVIPSKNYPPKQESKVDKDGKIGNQNKKNSTLVPSKTNKAQNMEKSTKQEPENILLEQITDSVVMSVKERAAIIVKHRKRWKTQGNIHDNVTSLALSLLDDLDNIDADPETIQKKIAVINILANTLDVTTRAAKIISEVELPLCGITPEDFKQSEQDRRLGALESLGDIDGEERAARERLTAELQDRLRWIEHTASSSNFGQTENQDNDSIDDIHYTKVED